MPTMPPTLRSKGWRPKEEIRREVDARRGSARDRGYDSRWEKASRGHRRSHPVCAYCELDGRVEAATLVDHLYPHRTFRNVFWVRRWWVSSCDACHNGMKQAVERAGKAAIDALARRLGLPVLGEPGGEVDDD